MTAVTRPYDATSLDERVTNPAEAIQPRDEYGHFLSIPLTCRFWEKVDKNGENGCWNWTASLRDGYGQLGYGDKRPTAHRLSWEIHFGAIPDGLWVLHKCDNRACVNPDHLFLGTVLDNIRDMIKKGRRPKRGGVGEHNAKAKLTETDVRSIGLAYANKEQTVKELASLYPVSLKTIWDITGRRTWRHIE